MKINAFKKSYGGRTVLDFPGYELAPGRIYAVIGANGSGKSTLAKYVSGIIKDDEGRRFRSGGELVGYMPQKPYIFRMSVKHNIAITDPPRGRVREITEAMDIFRLFKVKAHNLSGGESQRVALARILAGDHTVLVLDEPTSAMDISATLKSEALVKGYCHDHGAAVLLITHSISQASRIADDVLFISEGVLTEHAPPDKLFSAPENELTKRFLDFYET